MPDLSVRSKISNVFFRLIRYDKYNRFKTLRQQGNDAIDKSGRLSRVCFSMRRNEDAR
jgi:hypothetical protein